MYQFVKKMHNTQCRYESFRCSVLAHMTDASQPENLFLGTIEILGAPQSPDKQKNEISIKYCSILCFQGRLLSGGHRRSIANTKSKMSLSLEKRGSFDRHFLLSADCISEFIPFLATTGMI